MLSCYFVSLIMSEADIVSHDHSFILPYKLPMQILCLFFFSFFFEETGVPFLQRFVRELFIWEKLALSSHISYRWSSNFVVFWLYLPYQIKICFLFILSDLSVFCITDLQRHYFSNIPFFFTVIGNAILTPHSLFHESEPFLNPFLSLMIYWANITVLK